MSIHIILYMYYNVRTFVILWSFVCTVGTGIHVHVNTTSFLLIILINMYMYMCHIRRLNDCACKCICAGFSPSKQLMGVVWADSVTMSIL